MNYVCIFAERRIHVHVLNLKKNKYKLYVKRENVTENTNKTENLYYMKNFYF